MALTEAQKRAIQKYRSTHKEVVHKIYENRCDKNPNYRKDRYEMNLDVERERSRNYQRRKNMYLQEVRRLTNLFSVYEDLS